MKAMVLAAGLGTRLRSLGLSAPKALVEVAGEPLLARQLRYLAAEGVARAVVNAHHMADQVEAFAAEAELPLEVVVIVEPQLLGTAGGVRNALEQLGRDPFAVLYGDVVTSARLGEMEAAHRRAGAAATLAVYESPETEGKGTVEAGEDGLITAFKEKGGHDGPGPALINAGLYVVEPDLVADLEPGRAADFGFDVFPAALSAGRPLLAHRLAEPVIDVGTPEGLAAARALASS